MRKRALAETRIALLYGERTGKKRSNKKQPKQPRVVPGGVGLVSKFSRRAFLVGSGAAGIAAATLDKVPAAVWVETIGRTVVVHFGANTWVVDPRRFEGRARADWWRSGASFEILLEGALLPGTDISPDFRASIFENHAGWQIAFRMPQGKLRGNCSLKDWIAAGSAIVGTSRVRGFNLGDNRVILSAPIEVAIDSSFQIKFGGLASFAGLRAKGGTIALALGGHSSSRVANLFETVRGLHTEFEIESLELFEAKIPFGANGNAGFAFRPGEKIRIYGQAFRKNGMDQSEYVLDGTGSLTITPKRFREPTFAALEIDLERSLLLFESRSSVDVTLVARVCRAPQFVDIGIGQAKVVGNDQAPLYLQSRAGRVGTLRLSVGLRELHVPTPDADAAIFSSPDIPVSIVVRDSDVPIALPRLVHEKDSDYAFAAFGDDPKAERPGLFDTDRITRNQIEITSGIFTRLGLDDAQLTLRRGVDLFNQTYSFKGFELSGSSSGWFLSRRRAGNRYFPASIGVHFGPQHISEQFWEKEGNLPIRFDAIARGRLSGPSRIFFTVDKVPGAKTDEWDKPRRLSIEGLTDWKDLALVVNQRARDPDESAHEHLKFLNIDTRTSLPEAMDRIAQTLGPPREHETSLEMTSRLLLSPAKSAKWETPYHRVDPTKAVLWHARLDQNMPSSVRALWSTMLAPGIFYEEPGFFARLFTHRDREALPNILSKVDHWEIVGQTSVYGMVAARKSKRVRPTAGDERRLQPASAEDNEHAKLDLMQAKVVALLDENGQSVKSYIDEVRANYQVGLFMPQPFNAADIILTSIGGTFVAEWAGEPPRIPQELPVIQGLRHWPKRSFEVERLAYRSQLGRDIKVEVVRKGYLLPLGVRAAKVTLTERAFYRHPIYSYPVAYLVRREFIVIREPVKRFPAALQPFASRDFPAQRIRMLTKNTPDLIQGPKEGDAPLRTIGPVTFYKGGRLVFKHAARSDRPAEPEIFWPQIADAPQKDTQTILNDTTKKLPGGGADFQFEWTVDDDETPIRSPLLFVSNSALDHHARMKEVVEYYRTLKQEGPGPTSVSLRTARLEGSRRRYAPTAADQDTQDGHTAFDTDSWLLSCRGLLATNEDPSKLGSFQLMGEHVDDDQPPFYPFVENAKVTVQSVDRLIGRPQGLVTVSFHKEYTQDGFLKTGDPEIYLDIEQPRIELNVGNNGGATGGIARPNMQIVGLSRKIGPVGGAASVGGGGQGPKKVDWGVSRDGGFKLEHLFDDNAKLLGIIKFKEIIKLLDLPDIKERAPKLLETIKYGSGLSLSQLETRANIVKLNLLSFKSSLEKAIKGVKIKGLEAFKTVEFEDLYPTLDTRLDALIKSLESPLNFTGIATAGKAVIGELERIRRDPLPKPIRDVLASLNESWTALSGALKGADNPTDFSRILLSALDPFFKAAGNQSVFALLGLSSERQLKALLDGDLSVINREVSLFGGAFADPLRELLNFARQLRRWKVPSLFDKNQLHTELRAGLRAALDHVRDQLANGADIESELVASGFVEDIEQAIEISIKRLESEKSAAPAQWRGALREFSTKRASVLGEIVDKALSKRSNSISPKQLDQAEILRKQFTAKFVERVASFIEAQINRALADYSDKTDPVLGDDRIQDIRALMRAVADIHTHQEELRSFASDVLSMRTLTGWCDSANPLAARLAQTIASLFGKPSAAVGKIAECIKEIDEAAIPQSHEGQVVRDAIAPMHGALKKLRDAASSLDPLLGQLRAVKPAVCTDVAAASQLLDTAGKVFDQAHEVAESIRELAKACSAFHVILGPTGGEPGWRTVARQKLEALHAAAAVASQELAVSASAWNGIRELLAPISRTTLFSKLDKALTEARALEQALKEKNLSTIKTPQELQSFAHEAWVSLIKKKEFAGVALQWASLTQAAANALTSTSTGLIRGLAGALTAVYELAETPLEAAAGMFRKINEVANKYLTIPLMGDDITKAHEEFVAEIAIIREMARPRPPAQPNSSDERVMVLSRQLAPKWKADGPALLPLVNAFVAQVDALRDLNLSQLLRLPDLGKLREMLLAQLKNLVSELLPTEAEFTYNFDTQINSPTGGIFRMSAPARRNAADLRIRSLVKIDFRNAKRTANVHAALKPFEIKLIGDAPDLAKIKFEFEDASFGKGEKFGATFRADEGHAPKFQARVKDVETGRDLEFIKALESFFSPPKDGPFRYKLRPDRIEVGFSFGAATINVGAVAFINIAIAISARLPLDDRKADFVFGFADPDRPFLISSPPYGGGGYIHLIATAGDKKLAITGFELSFVFGAVVDISFGPLKAHGRVTSGVYITQSPDERSIAAVVEAVGEGNIAIFSICVHIQVGLRQKSGGSLEGFSRYSFTFRVGFARLRFQFVAQYRIQGGSAKKPANGGGGAAASGKKVTNRSPRKSRNWAGYKERIALDLL